MNGRSVRLALCSMVVALCTAMMFLTGIIPVGLYAFPALSGIPNLFVVIAFGTGWAWAVYLAVSLLSFLLSADKEAALLYFLLFGCYPVLKAALEGRFSRRVAFLLKFLFFNTAACVEFFAAVKILGVPQDSFTFFGISVPWLFLILGNAAFLCYDYALSRLALQYGRKIHQMVSKWFRPR